MPEIKKPYVYKLPSGYLMMRCIRCHHNTPHTVTMVKKDGKRVLVLKCNKLYTFWHKERYCGAVYEFPENRG